jgi:hypothetical protein
VGRIVSFAMTGSLTLDERRAIADLTRWLDEMREFKVFRYVADGIEVHLLPFSEWWAGKRFS